MAHRDAFAKAEGTSRQERNRVQRDALAKAEGTSRQERKRAQKDALAEAEGTTRQKRAQKRQKEVEAARDLRVARENGEIINPDPTRARTSEAVRESPSTIALSTCPGVGGAG